MAGSGDRDLRLFRRHFLMTEAVVGDLIDFQQRRKHLLALKGFQRWQRRFGGCYGETTSAQDLPDEVLYQLIQGENANGGAIEELVWGVLEAQEALRGKPRPPSRMESMDITLFVLDQLRFEAMRRLDWISEHSLAAVPLVEMIDAFSERYAASQHWTPPLAESHPRFAEYCAVFEGDRDVFLRRMIPELIETFRKRLDMKH